MDYKNIDPRILKINTNELCARLAIPLQCDFDFSDLYERLVSEAKPAYVTKRVELIRENGEIRIGGIKTSSKALWRFSSGSSGYILLVATLGIGVDRLILKTSKISAKESFIIDAMADALIEALCDYAQKEVGECSSVGGRFSPGYADLPLSIQSDLLNATEANKYLHITLSDSLLMIPQKSITAMIGIKAEDGKGE